MSVIAHGIDIVECARIGRMWEDHGDRFVDRLYTPAEREHCLNCKTPIERLSGRFAAKEAILKVLGTGLRGGLRWVEMEILPDALGAPVVTLHGAAEQLARSRGIERVLISISHTRQHATASAIGVGEMRNGK
ncbi:MAG: holo-ACP synthase [Phycisphaerae bacterium]|nr:holo-ACP synthase [Phycisphaerae bacterium]